MPRQHRYAVAALEMWMGRGQIPTVGQCWCQRIGESPVVGSGLLQAHHVGIGFLQPRQQSEVVGGPLLDRSADAVDVDGTDGQRCPRSHAETLPTPSDSPLRYRRYQVFAPTMAGHNGGTWVPMLLDVTLTGIAPAGGWSRFTPVRW